MRLIPWFALMLMFACSGSGGGADAAPSGRACASGLAMGDPTALVSPALDCPSRVCLHVQGAERDLCTAFCNEASDCTAAAESACTAGFTCVSPTNRGTFACRKVCVCAGAAPGVPCAP